MKRLIGSQLRTAPEARVQAILYLMLVLLAYFIVDLGNTRSTQRTETLKKKISEVQADLTSYAVMIEQIQPMEKEIEELKGRQAGLVAERKQRIELLLECQDRMLLNVLRGQSSEQNTLQEFRLREDSSPGPLAQYIYQVDIRGGYPEVIDMLTRLDQSPCGRHLTHWVLSAENEEGDIISGSLYFRLYRRNETE